MAKTDTRAETIVEIVEWLAAWATNRAVEASQCSPGSDQRQYGLQVAREVAKLAVEIRQMA